ncbi:MAG: caspase family protein [Elusimicrobia bacterium]|nr:caspase family protein [Elusimicrobiota bacterium]
MKTALAAALCLLLSPAAGRAGALADAKAAYGAGDYAKALQLYQPLADQGDSEAQFQVGVLYEQGLGVDKDAIAARRWYDKAAVQGHPGAMMWIGHTYAEGDGVGQDYAEAMDWYRKAAEKKYPPAWTAIGGLYVDGKGVKKDLKESVRWYRKAAEAGDATGMVDLGIAYREGDGVPNDFRQAVKWSRKAADLGFVPAMNNVGWHYLTGNGVEKDYQQAFSWYKKAADLGDATGQASLGRMYLNGHGVPLDYGEALRLFHLAADQGDTDAMVNIGWCYDHAYGVKRDSKQAVEWLRKAADAGAASAQHYLGTLYYNGDGVPQDTAAGCGLFRLAAAQGYGDSIALLPRCPQEGAQAPAAAAGASPAAPASGLDAPAFRLKPRPSDLAVIVGIENYRRAPRADFAENDAAAVEANLLALGFPQRNIIRLIGDDATRSRIQAYLVEWLPKNVKPDSTVFFYYSGHGAPDPQSGEAYLLPSDGDPSFLKTTAYPLKEVFASLDRLPAKQVVVALDSCFSGAGGRSVIAQGARPLVTRMTAADTGRLVVFAAAQGEQIAGSNSADAHGLFTHHFLQGLAGGAKGRSGRVTARGLYDYLKPLVEDDARRENREQSPTLRGPGEAELVKF